jgi:hypothetical protein
VAEIEGRGDPESKKRRKIEGSFGLQGYEAPDDVWLAKEKAEWGMTGEGGEQLMLDGGDAGDEEYAALAPVSAAQGPLVGNGILSGSTLAALKGYTANTSVKRPAPAMGPLVGYGSDEDSD